MGKIKYSEELKNIIKQRYLSGELSRELANEYNIPTMTIFSLLEGLPKHKKQNPLIITHLRKDDSYYRVLGLIEGDGWVSKYSLGFCSKDKEMVDYVSQFFKSNNLKIVNLIRNSPKGTLIQNHHTKKDCICYEIRVNSKDLCEKVSRDLNNISSIFGNNLLAFIDGLFCAEGSVNKGCVSFSQNEPNFSRLLPIIQKGLGYEKNITTNQNGCKQAYWSHYDIKDKPIFTICIRKCFIFKNLISKYSRYSIRKNVLYYLNKNGKTLKELTQITHKKSSGNLYLLLERMVKEGLVNKFILDKKVFGRNLVKYGAVERII